MTNVAFAGLTAAGKTTHAQLLAADLGYDYISATDISFEILPVPGDTHPWFTRPTKSAPPDKTAPWTPNWNRGW